MLPLTLVPAPFPPVESAHEIARNKAQAAADRRTASLQAKVDSIAGNEEKFAGKLHRQVLAAEGATELVRCERDALALALAACAQAAFGGETAIADLVAEEEALALHDGARRLKPTAHPPPFYTHRWRSLFPPHPPFALQPVRTPRSRSATPPAGTEPVPRRGDTWVQLQFTPAQPRLPPGADPSSRVRAAKAIGDSR